MMTFRQMCEKEGLVCIKVLDAIGYQPAGSVWWVTPEVAKRDVAAGKAVYYDPPPEQK